MAGLSGTSMPLATGEVYRGDAGVDRLNTPTAGMALNSVVITVP